MYNAPSKRTAPRTPPGATSLAASATLADQRTASRRRLLVCVVFVIGFLVGKSVNIFQKLGNSSESTTAATTSTTKTYGVGHRQAISLRSFSSNDVKEEEETDPCSVSYWLSHLSSSSSMYPQGDESPLPLLEDLTADSISFLHITFSVQGSKDKIANDAKHGVVHPRDAETNHSFACLRKTLPQIAYRNVWLGDFESYRHALAAQHTWIADLALLTNKKKKEQHQQQHQQHASSSFPFQQEGSFVLDTDVYANPQSDLSVSSIQRALKNVDLALVYSPNRRPPAMNGVIHWQSDGLQGGIMGQRHNLRTRLFHQCVAHVLSTWNSTGNGVMRQQRAMNQVLESPVAQFLRIRWLPPEFHCWNPRLETLDEFVVSNGPGVQTDACYFVHSHNLVKNGTVLQSCSYDDPDDSNPTASVGFQQNHADSIMS